MTLACGFFDGVHLGHQSILRGADAALTFENHPLSVLAPERAPRLLMSWEDRAKTILALGVKVTALEFDRDLAARSPEEFLTLMRGLASPRSLSVRCGANWRFGKDGAGDADWLRARGVPVTVVPYVDFQGEPVSSTRIRRCLENGEIENANAMLGRRYQVSGTREAGKGLGRRIGYPTVNLRLSASASFLRLPLGVYEVEVEGVRGIANYGLAPTMGEQSWREPTLEIHFPIPTPQSPIPTPQSPIPNPHSPLPNPQSPIPTPQSPISFLRFIRPERKFDSLEALKAQIAADCAKIEA